MPTPLTLGKSLTFDPPLLLAPMDGVTDVAFRGLVADVSGTGALGGSCTAFVRVSNAPTPIEILHKMLGTTCEGNSTNDSMSTPHLGLQIMGHNPSLMAETAVLAAEAGAPWVDINFGCPARKVCGHGAGSILLEDLDKLEDITRQMADACPVPVTAKIRAGSRDDTQIEEIAQRVEQAGAAGLFIHARLRIQAYSEPADWSRITRAVNAVSIPVIGNGSADTPELINQMFSQTGCAGVMIGRAALANPWVFRDWADANAGREITPRSEAEYLNWLRKYDQQMQAGGTTDHHRLGKLKQLAKAWSLAGALPETETRAALRADCDLDFYASLAKGNSS